MSVFSIPLRVYYEDTDSGGVVYYANYLRFMERARTEWLRTLGFSQAELSERERVLFAVRAAQLEFVGPGRLDDLLTATLAVERRGSASLTFAQEIRRSDATLCRGEIKIACIDSASFKPKAIPAAINDRLDEWRNA